MTRISDDEEIHIGNELAAQYQSATPPSDPSPWTAKTPFYYQRQTLTRHAWAQYSPCESRGTMLR
jgi:hypothetical protein